jgi:hypothetical protein
VQLTDTSELSVSKPYRGFESLSLRHAVLTAENPCLGSLQNSQVMPVFCDFCSTNRTAEIGLAGPWHALVRLFLRRGDEESGFDGSP